MTQLPLAAIPAWEAYTAMTETKQRHYELLRLLEEKYERYGTPSVLEKAQLEQRLDEHDKRVNKFKTAVAALKIGDSAAYAALIARLAEVADESEN